MNFKFEVVTMVNNKVRFFIITNKMAISIIK